MWRAECRDCDFAAPRFTRDEAEDALIAHVQASKHLHWSLIPLAMDASEEKRKWQKPRKTRG
jgi:hypothetical protein